MRTAWRKLGGTSGNLPDNLFLKRELPVGCASENCRERWKVILPRNFLLGKQETGHAESNQGRGKK